MRLLPVLFFLTLVVASFQVHAASQSDYSPSKKPYIKQKSDQEDLISTHPAGRRKKSTVAIDAGMTTGFFYNKETQKSVLYLGLSKELDRLDHTWILAAQVGTEGHAFLKIGHQWDWTDDEQEPYQTKPRLLLVNDLEVSQYFASLVNYNHYKLEANLLVKNLAESDSGIHLELAVGYGLNGLNYSAGLGYAF